MEEPPVPEPHCPPPTHSDIHPDDAETLAIPPLDDAMFNFDFSFPEDFSGSGFTFDDYNDINLDDFEITEDLFFYPTADVNSRPFDPPSSEHDPFPSSQPLVPNSDPDSYSEIHPIESSDHGSNGQGVDVAGVFNSEINLDICVSRVNDCLTRRVDIKSDMVSSGTVPIPNSENWGLNGSIGSSNELVGGDSNSKLNHSSPDSVSCINLSPLRSGEWSSLPPPGENSRSSGSRECVIETSKPYHEKPNSAGSYSNIGPTESESKIEDVGRRKATKRKKKEDGISVSRNRNSRKSSVPVVDTIHADADGAITVGSEDDDEEKKKARLMRNRESAQLSRERKKQYVAELEGKVKCMHSTITDLNRKISYIMSENAALRQQLSGAGVYPPPNPGMFPIAPMGYPWVPYPPYMVNPQGSNVPLVPIPRIKPQGPDPAPKVSRKSGKPVSKKSDGKTKKVASVSFLGLLFFFLLFAGLVPMVNLKYGLRIGETASESSLLSDIPKGRVLMVDGDSGKSGNEGGMDIVHVNKSPGEHLSQSSDGDDCSFAGGNSTKPLVASLYVPRNDKLVQIDGNLIIHSVLASERALISGDKEKQVQKGEETISAIPRNPVSVYHVAGTPRVLDYVAGDNLKLSASDGSLQQWFHAGHEGPLLSSGVCTKVYEFDVTPTPGSIVPITSMPNSAAACSDFLKKNATLVNRSKNRKVLRGPVIPINNQDNVTEECNLRPNAQGVGLEGNKSSSSVIVVSVLVDPRDSGYVEGETVISSSQSLSRIFVVLLVDGVKYITYSCMLPRMGSSSHLVRS